jgi:hypothetical protein
MVQIAARYGHPTLVELRGAVETITPGELRMDFESQEIYLDISQ